MAGMGFSETIFLFFLALLIFGPKKLPEIARQAAKVMNDLRRASYEFKSQIESEIAHMEVQKQSLPPAPPPQGAIASLSASPPVVVESSPPPTPPAPASEPSPLVKAPDA